MTRNNEGNTGGKNNPIDKQIKKIIEEERKHIRGQISREPLSGIALSGGGIRSASFALGVMQALYAGYDKPSKELLRRFDYQSTVSGGGYIGTALTWFCHQDVEKKKEEQGDVLGRKGVGARSEDRIFNQRLNFIRQHGNYLTPEKRVDLVSFFSVLVRTMFTSLAIYLSFTVIIMKTLMYLAVFQETTVRNILGFTIATPFRMNFLFVLFIGLSLLLAGASLVYSLLTKYKMKKPNKKYALFIFAQKFFGFCSKVLLLLGLIGSLPYVHSALDEAWQRVTAAGLFTAIGSVIGFLQSRKEHFSTKKADVLVSQNLLAVVGAFFLVYGLLLAAYILAGRLEGPIYFFGLVAITLLFAIVVNVNYSGLHRMYRDRLMETFMPNRKNVQDNNWGPATEANVTKLGDVLHVSGKGKWPYQLINANVVLVDSDDSRYRGRGGDSFLLSPLFCGSYATGYCATGDFENTIMSPKGMSLPTAMAISGAAANPNSGVAGKGVTRNKLVSMLMSLLNLRLGYWVLNPGRKTKTVKSPNYLIPGLWKGVFGIGLDEKSYFVELTDGGHFENLGLYELIRRRVKLIVASDGGADPKYTFEDLANAVERVRVDFGVKIRFRECEECSIEGVLPSSARNRFFNKKYHLARRGFAIADIIYDREDPNQDGTLLYIKPTLTEGLPQDIYGYKSAHKTFPDQPTTDQFFDEAQFEAYRELGYQLTKKMLMDIEVQRVLKGFFKL